MSNQAAATVIAQAKLPPGAHVLEIGPGLGALTKYMLNQGVTVLAIERDPQRVTHLKQQFDRAISTGNLTIIAGDATRVLPTLPADWHVVANPPFSLTAPLVRHWLLAPQPPKTTTLVLQREAAEKLTGRELAHTRSSILSHLVGKPLIAKMLPRDSVTPPSRVDLAIWQHHRHDQAIDHKLINAVDRLLDIAFAGPRTMREAMRGVATTVQIRRQASEHGWHLDDHPRTVSPKGWAHFASLLLSCDKLPQPAKPSPPRKR